MNPASNEEQPSKAWLADGLAISQRVTIACLGLVLPLVAGYWLGGQTGFPVVGLIVGFLVGLIASGALLVDLVKWLNLRQERLKRSRKQDFRGTDAEAGPRNPRDRATPDGESDEQEEDPWQKRWEEKWSDDWDSEDEPER